MKIPFYIFVLLFATGLHAQSFVDYVDSLDVNSINAAAMPQGNVWMDPLPYGVYPHCRFPEGMLLNVASAGGLWLSGYDTSNKLHVSAQTYPLYGEDYWAGPTDASGAITYAASYAWAKVWKVSRADIANFRDIFLHTRENTPHAILTWPGKGNTYARGNAGSPLVVNKDMAPFVDINGNGVYEPLQGDYPRIKGDQALWWAFTDNGPLRTGSSGLPLGVEILGTAYGYKRNTLIDNVIYYEYDIKNSSPNSYHHVRAALWADCDMSYYNDDYIGFDSSRRLGIWYDAAAPSGGGSAGYPRSGYRDSIPVGGLTIVHMPGDDGTNYMPAGSFTYFTNDASIIGDPKIDTEYNHYMRARLRNGAPITNDFAGAGSLSRGYGSGPATNYMYSGDPQDPTSWAECNTANNPGDRRIILSSNDFDLPAGSVRKIVFALVVAPRALGNFCPTITYNKIREVSDTAWGLYHNPPPPVAVTSQQPVVLNSIKLHPNPATNEVQIVLPDRAMNNAKVIIYNTLGQQLVLPLNQSSSGFTADVSTLVPGIYHVTCTGGGIIIGATFLKE